MPFKFLDEKVTKSRLIDSSLFLMAFHLLKSSIVQRTKEFFLVGFDQDGLCFSEQYNERVLSKSKYEFEASLLFLKELGAITDEDIEVIHELREFRNNLAHDIPSAFFEDKKSVDPNKIKSAGQLLQKIDRFWGSIDVDINPDYDGVDVDYEGIESIIFQYIMEIVRGEDESSI